MTRQILTLAFTALVVAGAGFTANADSPRFQHQHGQVSPTQVSPSQLRVQLVPDRQPERPSPKLGINAIDTGRGVEVDRVFYNTPAKRLGLECGDRIVEINGTRVRSIYDMQQALREATRYHNGQIRVLVDNVRARHGGSSQRYVTVRTYLDGYSNQGGWNEPQPVYTAPRDSRTSHNPPVPTHRRHFSRS